jgi:hypothetical protein
MRATVTSRSRRCLCSFVRARRAVENDFRAGGSGLSRNHYDRRREGPRKTEPFSLDFERLTTRLLVGDRLGTPLAHRSAL